MSPTSNHIHAAPVVVEHIGKVVIPEAVQQIQPYRLWTVLQVGPGRITRKGVRIPVECTAGDRLVTTANYIGPEWLPDGTAIIKEPQILAVIPKTQP